jgi:hypothetical protein
VEISEYQIGQLYENHRISKDFRVGTQGGIRYAGGHREGIRHTVVIFGEMPEIPYQPRWTGSTLIFTGEGLRGDQELSKGNLVLFKQLREGFPLYAFRKVGKNQYRYLGRMKVVGFGREVQRDLDGKDRTALTFELKTDATPEERPPALFPERDSIERLRRLRHEIKREKAETKRHQHRQEMVSILKQLYDYLCQLCGEEAPVVPPIPMKNQTNYVEVHQVAGKGEAIRLTAEDQGSGEYVLDDPEDAVVVCPYHHKLLHHYKSRIRFDRKKREFRSEDGSLILPLRLDRHLQHQ